MMQGFTGLQREIATNASSNQDFRQMLQALVANTEHLRLQSDISHSMLADQARQLPALLSMHNKRGRRGPRITSQDKEWAASIQAEIVQQVTNHLQGNLHNIEHQQCAAIHNAQVHPEEDSYYKARLSRFRSLDNESLDISNKIDSDQEITAARARNINDYLPSFVSRSERRIFKKSFSTFLGALDLEAYRSNPLTGGRQSRHGDLVEIEAFVRLNATLYSRALQLSIVYDRTHSLSSPTNFRLQVHRVCAENDPISWAIEDGNLQDFVTCFQANRHTPNDLVQNGRASDSLLFVCLSPSLESFVLVEYNILHIKLAV